MKSRIVFGNVFNNLIKKKSTETKKFGTRAKCRIGRKIFGVVVFYEMKLMLEHVTAIANSNDIELGVT